ncbi:MAG: biotin/lipoyl-binding protein [Thermoanaerobaculales bacterium]|jgi:biotin carboxyl carrier protein|nr:biotin/lipoyl-binding protein [Thermoanaerobaculales bacterium]
MSEYVLRVNGREYRVRIAEITPQQARVVVDGVEYAADLVTIARSEAPAAPSARPAAPRPGRPAATPAAAQPPAGSHGNVRAPLPGLVLEVKVREGAVVKAGDPLVVLEAMKMENVVQAPHNGTVRKLFVAGGDSVAEGDPLLEMLRPEMTTL